MNFKFKIDTAHEVGGRIFVLDGLLETGIIKNDVNAIIVELSLPIHIKSVGIGSTAKNEEKRISIHIDKPSFPLSKIKSGMILRG